MISLSEIVPAFNFTLQSLVQLSDIVAFQTHTIIDYIRLFAAKGRSPNAYEQIVGIFVKIKNLLILNTDIQKGTETQQLTCNLRNAIYFSHKWDESPYNGKTCGPKRIKKIAGNGTLYFPPFLSQYYRTDVHETTYRCRATNEAGTILSRNVRVQAGKVKKIN
uniref:Ig-like domain-containing protein n=1 Tax=Glossina austeni TaxID=7395 RepID=A0A1A9UEN7_GLOAU